MKLVPFSLIIPTIGIPHLFQMLDSVAGKDPMPDQVVVVIDNKGRLCSNLRGDGSIKKLEADIRSGYPFVEVLHNRHDADWQMNNQTFNIGIEHARNEYVYVTHDDVFFPDESGFFAGIGRAIGRMGEGGFSKEVIGAVFPGYHEEVAITAPHFQVEGLSQYYSAVSSLLSKRCWEAVGRFDERHGIWWDAQMQGEMRKRDWWMYYVPMTPVHHYMNRALRANGHADGWKLAPLWSDCAAAYARFYGGEQISWGEWYNRPGNFIEFSNFVS